MNPPTLSWATTLLLEQPLWFQISVNSMKLWCLTVAVSLFVHLWLILTSFEIGFSLQGFSYFNLLGLNSVAKQYSPKCRLLNTFYQGLMGGWSLGRGGEGRGGEEDFTLQLFLESWRCTRKNKSKAFVLFCSCFCFTLSSLILSHILNFLSSPRLFIFTPHFQPPYLSVSFAFHSLPLSTTLSAAFIFLPVCSTFKTRVLNENKSPWKWSAQVGDVN